MFAEFFHLLSDWFPLDTWMVVTGALSAMSCALPGAWLLLRRQSLLGDALSHSVLPGIVLAYLALHRMEQAGWIATDSEIRHLVIFLGAVTSGILSAVITELIQRWGQLDRSAAIGVVFTSMFALGLLLIRLFADQTHVDPSCVLYGSLETSAGIKFSHSLDVPRAAVVSAIVLALNGLLVMLFFKELRLSTFDPGLAAAIGLRANWIQLALMAMTAATLVAAFESVGAILVIAMLIVPAATARLLTDRLSTMLILSMFVAAFSALLGHVGAITLPQIVFSRLGYPDVHGASTTGMMAVAGGVLFVLAMLLSPKHGFIRKRIDDARLRIRIASEDILGMLYRRDEASPADASFHDAQHSNTRTSITWIDRLAQRLLQRHGLITDRATSNMFLTEKGRDRARNLIRSHRLWEAYMARHFQLPGDHFHSTAEQVEHYLSPQLQIELADELNQPQIDPHGKAIPGSSS